MADEREIQRKRQTYRSYADDDLIRVMREKVSYSAEHIAAEQELHSRTKSATVEARKQIMELESDIERRHREQLEHVQAALQVSIQHHQETMARDQRIHDRQLAQSRWASWLSAAIAILAMSASWASIWFSHAQSNPEIGRLQTEVAALKTQLAGVDQRLVAASATASAAAHPAQPPSQPGLISVPAPTTTTTATPTQSTPPPTLKP